MMVMRSICNPAPIVVLSFRVCSIAFRELVAEGLAYESKSRAILCWIDSREQDSSIGLVGIASSASGNDPLNSPIPDSIS